MGKKQGLKRIICILLITLLIGVIFSQYISVDFFSKKAEHVRPTISIINIQSYPKVGGFWSVSFKVKGTADLIITPVDGTTWSEYDGNNSDLVFQCLTDDTASFTYEWKNNQVIIENFSSDKTIIEVSKVQTLGKHVLKFTFGDDVAFAYNDASNWWNSNWGFRKKITINSSQVAGDLENFPVLLNITDVDLKDKAQPNGDDITFISFSDNSTQYAHEIESYDPSDGSLIAWVNITRINSSKDTCFWLYYNNSACSNQENPIGVWDNNFIGVWHLNETDDNSGALRWDSTGHNNDGITVGYDGDESIDGLIDGADDFDGVDDYINFSHDDSMNTTDSITMEGWFYHRSGGWTYPRIMDKYPAPSIYIRESNELLGWYGYIDGTSRNFTFVNSSIAENVWSYISVSYSNDTIHAIKSYVNGSLKDNITSFSGSLSTTINPLLFGNSSTLERNIDGILDEIRISNIARNRSWIMTTYNVVQNQSLFFSIGNEESAGPFVSNPNPADGNNNVPSTPSYFQITIFDPNPDLLNITWRTNASGNWNTFNITNGSGNGVTDGTYQVTNTSWASIYSQPYWWSVNVTDGSHWTNQTFQFTLHQFTPKINSFILANDSGNKSNNQTGRISIQQSYYFLLNISDTNGWDDIDFINITCWYDQGNDAASSFYNKTKGGNINMFLQYQNTTGTASFKAVWPTDEISFSSENCSETKLNETTRLINISFTPGVQFRYAISNNTWNTTTNDYNDPYSWNINYSVTDSLSNVAIKKDEFGVNWYSSISATETVEINGAPGMNTTSSIMVIAYSCNYNYHLFVYMDTNFSQIDGSDIIGISGNLSLLENADITDELTVNTTFTGIGQAHAITLLNTNAKNNGTSSTVDVQFQLSIPFGTWGKYTSTVVQKIQRVD